MSIDSAVLKLETQLDYGMANTCFDYIRKKVMEFQATLDDNHEVGIMLASFGKNITMNVTGAGYQNPNLIIFEGIVEGSRAELVQHMSQLNFLLVALPKAVPTEPPRRIGF